MSAPHQRSRVTQGVVYRLCPVANAIDAIFGSFRARNVVSEVAHVDGKVAAVRFFYVPPRVLPQMDAERG